MTVRVAYILGEFPSRSETFIAREIEGLCRLGARVTIFSIRGKSTATARAAAAQLGAEGVVHRRSLLSDDSTRRVRKDASIPLASPFDPVSYYRVMSAALTLERADFPVCIRAQKNARTALGFAREIARRGLLHVHAHFATVPTTLAFMIQSLVPVRVSFSAHAQDIWLHWPTLPQKIGRADLVLTCNHHNRQALLGYCSVRHANKIHAVYHGVDVSRFTPAAAPRPGGPPVILAVGRLVAKKGFCDLVRACDILRKAGMPFRCRIVGYGRQEKVLKRMIAAKGLGSHVALAGFVPNQDILPFYEQATVLACPSVFHLTGDRDSLPNVILEAMAAGVPVVASNISAIPEAIEHERTGLLVPDTDPAGLARALQRILSDAALGRRLAAAAREKVVAQFDYRRNARRIYELFEAIPEPVGARGAE